VYGAGILALDKVNTVAKMVGRKGVKSEELKLQCEWSQCGNIYIDLGEFYQHLAYHYHVDFEVNQGTGENKLIYIYCPWRNSCRVVINCPYPIDN